jgi:protein TonB
MPDPFPGYASYDGRFMQRRTATISAVIALHIVAFFLYRLSWHAPETPIVEPPVFLVELKAKGAPDVPTIRPSPPTLLQPTITITTPQLEMKQEPTTIELSTSIAEGEYGGTVRNAGDPNGTVLEDDYYQRLVRHLQRFIIYPEKSQHIEEGTARVRLTITRTGKVLAATIAATSGYEELDKEGTAVMERAQPLPVPPTTMKGDPLVFIFPVIFKITQDEKICSSDFLMRVEQRDCSKKLLAAKNESERKEIHDHFNEIEKSRQKNARGKTNNFRSQMYP